MDIFIPEEYVMKRQEMKRKKKEQEQQQQQQLLVLVQTERRLETLVSNGFTATAEEKSYLVISPTVKSTEVSFDLPFSCFSP
ncbi:hypothetical protein AAC387_Pa08g2186 [Persea americana]